MTRADLASMRQALLRRADAAARRAGELAVDWFWIRRELRHQRAERLSNAAERHALAAHRAGFLWRPWPVALAQSSQTDPAGAPKK